MIDNDTHEIQFKTTPHDEEIVGVRLAAFWNLGAHRVCHTQKLLELSVYLSMIVEVVESRAKIGANVPMVDELVPAK
jgi:PII-like signaling protein